MKSNEIKQRMIRHGEMLLVPVDVLPENVEQIFEGREYIVAHSETGHHHVAVAEAVNAFTVFRPIGADTQDIYLRANVLAHIEHRKTSEKHETKTIHPGLYLCRPKSEYDPFKKLMRQVRD